MNMISEFGGDTTPDPTGAVPTSREQAIDVLARLTVGSNDLALLSVEEAHAALEKLYPAGPSR